MFTVPKQLKLKVIVVRSPDEQSAVNQELSANKSFSDVASAHSVDATKSIGGDYGTVPITVLGPKIKDALEGTKIGQDTPWITSQNSGSDTVYAKFHVIDVIPAKLQPLDANLKHSIRRKMMLERGSIKNSIEKEMATARSQAKIDITEKSFADAYKKFIDAYLKQQSN
jgi:parvulin-like peptidyl-prolyl isomerase